MHDRLANRDYDCFEYNEHAFLKDKIGFSKFGPPNSAMGYDSKQMQAINETYKQILKYNDEHAEWPGQVIVSFIFNCLEPLMEEKLAHANKCRNYNPKTDIIPVPIYVIQKCKGSINPCRIFIDHENRVYYSWKSYLDDNKLDRCVMVVPENGCYKSDEDNCVITENHLTSSCGIGNMILNKADLASTLIGFASSGILLAASIPTVVVAPMALSLAAATGLGAGIYSMVRGALTIYDKQAHGEEINVTNSDARGAYLNIIAGSLGFVGDGTNQAVAYLTSRNINIGKGARVALKTVRMMQFGAKSISLAEATYDAFEEWMKEQEKPSYLSFLQLKSSILFFTNYNFSAITEDHNEANAISDLHYYQDLLESNEGRKRRRLLESIFYGTEEYIEILPILTIYDTYSTYEILRQYSTELPHGIIFTFRNGEIYLNGVLLNLFKFSGKAIELPRENPDVTESETLITLKSLGLDNLADENSHFDNYVGILLKDFNEVLKDKLIVLFTKLVSTIDVSVFEKCSEFILREPLTAILELLLHFIEFKINEYELAYEHEKHLAIKELYFNEDEFHINIKVPKCTADRALMWTEKSIDECNLEEAVKYEMSKIAEKIYCCCVVEEKRVKRAINTCRNLYKIRCQICDGFYFSKTIV